MLKYCIFPTRFDSILVRLKVAAPIELCEDPAEHCFDSILVRLKVEDKEVRIVKTDRFRFHTGSIKRVAVTDSKTNTQIGFDSILVRLKDAAPEKHQLQSDVSIPYWFD